MIYIVVSENEIVKAEMERPECSAWEIINPCVNKDRLIKPFQEHCLSLPRIPAPGHKWKLWDEVVENVDFKFKKQSKGFESGEWEDCTDLHYSKRGTMSRRIVAIPIQPTPEGEKVFGEWQLCPKCNGDGNLARYNSPSIISTDASLRCDVCNGAKILARPLLTNDNPQTP